MEPRENNEPESPPISLSRFNIKPIPPRIQKTFFGKIRAFNTFTVLEWAYLAASLLALTASLGITIQRLSVEKPNEIFCYHYVVHSIFTERWDELMVFVISNVIVLGYCIANYVTGAQPLVKLIRLILVCIFSPFLIGVGVFQSFQYCRSNNLISYTVGPISSLQSSCRFYYICSSLLKFDLQLQLSMLILVMGKGVLSMSLEQKIILASGVPVTFLFIIVGFLGLRYENKALMVLFYILSLFEPAYIIYKFYYTVTSESNKDAIYDSTFVCGYFALVIWLLLVCATVYFMFYHFGKGLKEKMFEDNDNVQPRRSTRIVNEEDTFVSGSTSAP